MRLMFIVQYENVSAVLVAAVVAAVLTATLKAGNAAARSVPPVAVAYDRAPTGAETKPDGERRNKSTVSSYFRHDPYGPNTYAFGYELEDPATGNVQFRDERRHVNGTVAGSFGYVRPDGRVTLTRFVAERGRGYQSHTASYGPGEEHKWADQWPTRRPSILLDRGDLGVVPGTVVTFDQRQHLNVTEGGLDPELVQGAREQLGLELGGGNGGGADDGAAAAGSREERPMISPLLPPPLPPSLLDIVQGKVPLTVRPRPDGGTSMGFETVHGFIPEGFPIVPFELPQREPESDPQDSEQKAQTEEAEKKPEEAEKKPEALEEERAMESKYARGKKNNDEKAMAVEALRRSAQDDGRSRGDGGQGEGAPGSQQKGSGGTGIEVDAAKKPEVQGQEAAKRAGIEAGSRGDNERISNGGGEEVVEGRGNDAWYERIFSDAREEFLQNLPDLH